MNNGVMGIAFGTNTIIFRHAYIPEYKGAYFFVEYEDIENDTSKIFLLINERNRSALKQSQQAQ
jgi:hypothetical protein